MENVQRLERKLVHSSEWKWYPSNILEEDIVCSLMKVKAGVKSTPGQCSDLTGQEWIVMLPAHLVADNGLQLIEEIPHLRSNIRRDVGD